MGGGSRGPGRRSRISGRRTRERGPWERTHGLGHTVDTEAVAILAAGSARQSRISGRRRPVARARAHMHVMRASAGPWNARMGLGHSRIHAAKPHQRLRHARARARGSCATGPAETGR
jgi:hypothetical protein